jgi:hypothetical protein
MNQSKKKALAELLERDAIASVLRQYSDGMESSDGAKSAACFTDDAVIDYGFTTLRGRAEIDAHLSGSSKGISLYGIDRKVSTMHQVANVRIVLNGKTADVFSEGISIHAGWRDEQPIVVMRSIANRDAFRRVKGRWLIQSRVHSPGWRVELPAVEVGEAHT